eukprot:1149386-Pelagomonas_calceolata.AAC.2
MAIDALPNALAGGNIAMGQIWPSIHCQKHWLGEILPWGKYGHRCIARSIGWGKYCHGANMAIDALPEALAGGDIAINALLSIGWGKCCHGACSSCNRSCSVAENTHALCSSPEP